MGWFILAAMAYGLYRTLKGDGQKERPEPIKGYSKVGEVEVELETEGGGWEAPEPTFDADAVAIEECGQCGIGHVAMHEGEIVHECEVCGGG